jgi:hypothetical protein
MAEAIEYGTRAESSRVNEVLYRLSSLVTQLEQYGILSFSPSTTYQAGSRVLWTDGFLYSAKVVVTGESPTASPSKWDKGGIELITHEGLFNSHGATSAATPNRLALRDSNGRLVGDITGNAATATNATTAATCSGNAATATNATAHINAFAQVHSGNGYQKLPNGLIFQWLTATTSTINGADTTVNLPTNFPNNFFSAQISIGVGSDPYSDISTPPMITGKTHGNPSTITIRSYSGLSNLVYIFAIGN